VRSSMMVMVSATENPLCAYGGLPPPEVQVIRLHIRIVKRRLRPPKGRTERSKWRVVVLALDELFTFIGEHL